jgi:hypothetical protein
MKSHDYAENVALDILSKTPGFSYVIAGRRVGYDTKTKKMVNARCTKRLFISPRV